MTDDKDARIAALEAELAAMRDAANRIEGDEILARLRSGSATKDEQYNVANSLAYLWAQDGLLSEAQREVDRLREQLAEVERPLDAQMMRLNANLIDANRAKIDAERDLAAERERREAAEKDAARYRWLRGDAPIHSERWPRWDLQRWDGRCWHSLERGALDAAIDAAMKD